MKTILRSILILGMAIVLTSCEEEEVLEVTLNKNALTLLIGESETLIATVSPDGVSEEKVIWSSDKPDVVTVDENGKVTALALGTAIITAARPDDNKLAICTVTVDLIAFAEIPAATFQMGYGSAEPGEWEWDEGTKHWVTLTGNFEISRYQITNEQYCVFLNVNRIGSSGIWEGAKNYNTQKLIYDSSVKGRSPWGVKWSEADDRWAPIPGKEEHPVVYVTWFGAKEFAAWMGGDLPTEAQWEHACRGDRGTLLFGVGLGGFLDGSKANIDGRYIYDMENGGKQDLGEGMGITLNATCAVGKYQPNSYGLYDMHGNVDEWCNDWYASNYGSVNATDEAIDPTGPVMGDFRVLRGGSWGSDAWGCHSASRYYFSPEDIYNHIGFRIVRP